MTWDLTPLIEIQSRLDSQIFARFGLSYAKTAARRRFALVVELAELANELRFFKFWSRKPPAAAAAVLDEFADVLHFALTFAVQYGAPGAYRVPEKAPSTGDGRLLIAFFALIRQSEKIVSRPPAVSCRVWSAWRAAWGSTATRSLAPT